MLARTPALFGCLMLGAMADAQAQPPETLQEFSCAQGAVTRTVTIISTPPSDRQAHGSCRVNYTKDGTTKTLWSASTGHAYCIKKATAFVTKLAEEHYTCNLKTKEQPDP